MFTVMLGAGMGVVREYCLGKARSAATRSVQVNSGWTYIVWPPLLFANLDPPGRCGRNSPLRQGLSAAGIRGLPSPEEQARGHIESQLRQAIRAGDDGPRAGE